MDTGMKTQGKLRRWRYAAPFIAFIAAAGTQARAAPVPPEPKYYVLDEPGVLSERQSAALGSLLIEHDQATGEQIMVAVLKSSDPEADAAERTREIYSAWDVSRRAGGNGGLLAVYLQATGSEGPGSPWKPGKPGRQDARIEVAYGLGTRLGEAQTRAAIRDFLFPELAAGQPYRALGLCVLEMLRAAESPLVESGRARDILRAGGLEGDLKPLSGPRARDWSYWLSHWMTWVAAGLVLSLVFLYRLVSAEAHFTSAGWYRPRPWIQAWQALRSAARARGRQSARPRGPGASSSVGGADAQW